MASSELSQTQTEYLGMLRCNHGYLAAGKQTLRGGRSVNIRASVLQALARRGLVTLGLSPDGGLSCQLKADELIIEATTYTRSDGVAMFRTPRGNWTVRSICGPAWFWSFETSQWVPVSAMKDDGFPNAFERPYDIARALLQKVPAKDLKASTQEGGNAHA